MTYTKIKSFEQMDRLSLNHHQIKVVCSLPEADQTVRDYAYCCSIRTDRDFGIKKDLPFYLVDKPEHYQDIRCLLQENLDAGMILLISNGRQFDKYLRFNMVMSMERDGKFQAEYCTKNTPLRHMYRYPSKLVYIRGNVNERFGDWEVDNREANTIDLREIRNLIAKLYLKVENLYLYGKHLELSLYWVPCGTLKEEIVFWEL